jgi:hypothetical protein
MRRGAYKHPAHGDMIGYSFKKDMIGCTKNMFSEENNSARQPLHVRQPLEQNFATARRRKKKKKKNASVTHGLHGMEFHRNQPCRNCLAIGVVVFLEARGSGRAACPSFSRKATKVTKQKSGKRASQNGRKQTAQPRAFFASRSRACGWRCRMAGS